MQSVFAPLKTNGCRDYVAVVGVRRCPPQSGSRMESEPGEIKLLSERESGGFCPLGLPAMQASERASIVSGAPYVGCASTMAAGPSISDTNRIAEQIDRVRYGKHAARTVPSAYHYCACATICLPSPCRGTTYRPETRSRILAIPVQCPMVSAGHSVPPSERQGGFDTANRSGRR